MLFVLSLCFLSFCNDSSSTKSKNKNDEAQFLAVYVPRTEKVLGDSRKLVLIETEDGEGSYSPYMDIYPDGDKFFSCSAINNNIFVMGLHSDFKEGDAYNGVYVEMDSKNQTILPLVAPSQDSDFPYYQSETGRVADNGMIVYMTATNDKYYGDEYRPHLARYNPADNTHKFAISPKGFTLGQPEKGGDTETGQINRRIFCSPNGRYAYGHIEAYGVSGNIHWDYEILFQYDFEEEKYTRLGEDGDADVRINMLTKDGKKLIYTNGVTKKIYDIDTKSVTEFDSYISDPVPTQISNNGFIRSHSSGIYYYDILNQTDVQVIDAYYPRDAHFSKDCDCVYFTFEGSDFNYICKSANLLEKTVWDTLATVPKEFQDIKIIK